MTPEPSPEAVRAAPARGRPWAGGDRRCSATVAFARQRAPRAQPAAGAGCRRGGHAGGSCACMWASAGALFGGSLRWAPQSVLISVVKRSADSSRHTHLHSRRPTTRKSAATEERTGAARTGVQRLRRLNYRHRNQSGELAGAVGGCKGAARNGGGSASLKSQGLLARGWLMQCIIRRCYGLASWAAASMRPPCALPPS